MGGAVLTGALRSAAFDRSEVGIYHSNTLRGIEIAQQFGVRALDEDSINQAERVLLAVKPQSFAEVAPLIARRNASFISLMAGVSAAAVARAVGSRRVLRAMPNLGARVGLSATALCALPEATSDDLAVAEQLFGAVGSVYHLPEQLFDAFTGLAGSGPAFVAVVAEALADGGVRVGFPRRAARELARQVLLATAMLLEEDSPAALKDEVASPGGTAIAGLRALEKHGLRFSLIEAVEQATERAAQLNGKDGGT